MRSQRIIFHAISVLSFGGRLLAMGSSCRCTRYSGLQYGYGIQGTFAEPINRSIIEWVWYRQRCHIRYLNTQQLYSEIQSNKMIPRLFSSNYGRKPTSKAVIAHKIRYDMLRTSNNRHAIFRAGPCKCHGRQSRSTRRSGRPAYAYVPGAPHHCGSLVAWPRQPHGIFFLLH